MNWINELVWLWKSVWISLSCSVVGIGIVFAICRLRGKPFNKIAAVAVAATAFVVSAVVIILFSQKPEMI